jgi:hypothetical protein
MKKSKLKKYIYLKSQKFLEKCNLSFLANLLNKKKNRILKLFNNKFQKQFFLILKDEN